MRTGLLVSICMSDNRLFRARASGTSGNSGCDRLRLWQAYVKLVSPDCNAVRELSEFSGMTTWSYNALPHGLQERDKAL